MRQTLLSFGAAITLLVVAFLPIMVDAAEMNDNVHFGQHLLILVAGLLIALGAQRKIGEYFALHVGRSALVTGIAGLGLVLFLISQIPAFDVLADSAVAFHMLQHLVILVAGVLIGAGWLLLTRVSSLRMTRGSHA